MSFVPPFLILRRRGPIRGVVFELPTPRESIGSADPGYDKAFDASVFLDFGYQKRLTNHLSWRLDLYNVLGWADIDLHKRNYINRNSDYRSEAAAVGVSATANY
jgi:hypothetical protein